MANNDGSNSGLEFIGKKFKKQQEALEKFFNDRFPVTVTDFLGMNDFPKVDVVENDKEFTVTADVPGFNKENIRVETTDTSVIVKGEVEKKTETNGAQFLRVERISNSFVKKVPLPSEIQKTNVVATLKDGVLTVVLPKVKPEETQPVPVTTE